VRDEGRLFSSRLAYVMADPYLWATDIFVPERSERGDPGRVVGQPEVIELCRRKAIHSTRFARPCPSALCLNILLRRNGGAGG
jgi:hypothetical protein